MNENEKSGCLIVTLLQRGYAALEGFKTETKLFQKYQQIFNHLAKIVAFFFTMWHSLSIPLYFHSFIHENLDLYYKIK